jgi:lipopolysaccharide/colanic/teichoic acid biosynthesis glycosyltransferase
MVHVADIATSAMALPKVVRKGRAYRGFDVMVSIGVLVLTSPVLLLAVLAILFESGGSPFYLQRRLGMGGMPFFIIKLRTMIPDAERDCGPKLAENNDPRITAVGRFLRKTHIDELPQFINVLKGEMSVVGPRPERPELHGEICNDLPSYNYRLCIEPGITGLAQVRGDYHLDFQHKLKYDMLYMRRQSILLDLKIIAETILVILSPRSSAPG